MIFPFQRFGVAETADEALELADKLDFSAFG